MQLIKNNWPYLVLIFIVALGAFLRLWDLSVMPPGIYPDEAKNANDAINTLMQNDWRVFYPENNGREGLYIWLIALSFKYLGINIFALKIVGALAGILTIIATYLVTKEIFKFSIKDARPYTKVRFSFFAREIASLLAAGFLATSFWHINFSRIGFRAILVPLFLASGLYFTLRALKTRKLVDVILSAIIWGLGYYTYLAFRLSIVIPVFLISASFIAYLYVNRPRANWDWFKKMYIHDAWWKFCLWGIVFAASLTPLIWHFVKNPADLISRSAGISVFAAQNPILAFAKSLGLNLQMLVWQGDANWRHNFSGDAQLIWPVAILFIAGIIYSVWVMYEGVRYKNWSMLASQLTLWIWFFAMLLPAALTTEGLPHALRAIGLMPVVFIFSAFGFLLFIKLLFPHRHHRSDIWPFGLVVALTLVLFLASVSSTHYFIDWGRKAEVSGAFSKNYVAIAEYFNTMPSDVHKYLIVNTGGTLVSYPRNILSETNTTGELPIPAQTVLFIQQIQNTAIANTTYLETDELPLVITGKNIFVPLNANDDIQQILRTRYPFGYEVQFQYFWIYIVDI